MWGRWGWWWRGFCAAERPLMPSPPHLRPSRSWSLSSAAFGSSSGRARCPGRGLFSPRRWRSAFFGMECDGGWTPAQQSFHDVNLRNRALELIDPGGGERAADRGDAPDIRKLPQLRQPGVAERSAKEHDGERLLPRLGANCL